MTMEVKELLSWVALDTSEHALGSSCPKEAGASGPSHTFAHQTGRFPQASGHIIPGEHPQ